MRSRLSGNSSLSDHLHRCQQPPTAEGHLVYSDRYLTVDRIRREVYVDGEAKKLSPIQYVLLSLFVQNPGKALSTEFLLISVWGPECGSLELVKWHVSHLRRKLANSLGERPPVVTVRGYGYRYDPEGTTDIP